MQYFINYAKNTRSVLITVLLFVLIYYLIRIGNRYLEADKALRISKKQFIKISIFSVFILVIIKIYISVPIVKDVIFAIIFSITIAYILNPLANFLEMKGIKRSLAIVLIYVVMITFAIVVYILIVPSMLEEISNLIDDFPDYIVQINNKIDSLYTNIDKLPKGLGNFKSIIDNIIAMVEKLITSGINNITEKIASTFSKILVLVLIPVITFYFLKDKELFKKSIILTCPKRYRDDLLKISRKMNVILGRFVRGQLILATFIGIASAVGLFFIKVKFWLIIGIVAGIASIIPYFGPIIGIIPALFFALLDSTTKAIWVIILFFAVQQFEGDILSPRIVGESVGLHPVIVMVVLLIGGGIFGVMGMLLSVPSVVFIKILMNHVIEKLDEMK
ncbi:AI-2E family transporter [Clostridiaceae bacterium M8S5]|nr:AI-2E family transporter [Clostridiaceae bacterium M8S5]